MTPGLGATELVHYNLPCAETGWSCARWVIKMDSLTRRAMRRAQVRFDVRGTIEAPARGWAAATEALAGAPALILARTVPMIVAWAR